MLRIYDTVIDIIRELKPTFDRIAKHDPALADQGRRASKSVALQISEGSYARGRNRQARYHGAAAEMMETISVLDVSIADGYIDPVDPALVERMRMVVATLWKCVR